MKTLKDLYIEIVNDPNLTQEFAKAVEGGKDTSIAFVREHGCDASFEEMINFLKAVKTSQEKEISPEEMEFIAGGSKEGAKEFFNDVLDTMKKGKELADAFENVLDLLPI